MKFKWTKIEENDFDEIKRILARDTLFNYPDFTEEFKIHTNVSDLQLGLVIIQKGKPIDLYRRKLTDSHKRNTVT